MQHADTSAAIADAAASRGLVVGQIIADGRPHRVPTVDRPNSRNGAYLARPDGSGWVMNHRLDGAPVPVRGRGNLSEVDRSA